MADEKIRYVLDVDDKGTPKLVRFGQASEKAGKQAEKAMGGAGQALQDIGGQIPLVGNAMSTLAGGPMAAAAAGAAAIVGGFGMMMKKAIDFADGMNDMADRTGLAVETLSSLALVSELGGTSLESVAQILGKFSSRVASGDKEIKSLNLTSKDAASAMIEIADKVKNAKTQTEAISIAQRAYGKQWQEMMPILKMGGDEVKRIMGETPKVSSEMAAAAARFNDSMSELKTQLHGVGLGIAQHILPHLQDWLNGVNKIRKAFGMLTMEESRAEGRQAIFDQYAELQETRRKAIASGAMKASDFKGKPITVGGQTLQQKLASYDAETARLAAPTPGSGVGGEYKTPEDIAAEAGAARAKAEQIANQRRAAREKADAESAKLIAEANKERNDKNLADQRNAAQRLDTLDQRIKEAEKARLEAIDREKKAKAELLQMDVDAAEERLKIVEKEATAFQARAQQELAIGNSNITAMIRGRQSMADTIDNIESAAKDRLIQKGLEYVEEMIAQQLMLVVFGDTIKAAEAAKAAALGAQQAAAYAPAAIMASTASFGGAAVAGGASLAAVLAQFAFRENGGFAFGNTIVGEKGPEAVRPVVPSQVINNHHTTGGSVTYIINASGSDAKRIRREIERSETMRKRGSR